MNLSGLTKLTGTIGGFVGRNSPTLLTGVGVAGLLSTAILVGKATPKALAILDDELAERRTSKIQPAINEITKEFTVKEVVGLTWKCYIPAAVMGAVTVGCIIGANSIHLRRNTALAGLYSLSETALKEYKTKVVEKIGEEKSREINDEIIKEKMQKKPVGSSEVIIGRGDTLCFDVLSGRYFWSDMESIKSAANKINVRMRSEMFVTVSDLYYELDLEGTKTGDLLGWYIEDGDFNPEFSSQLTEDGRPCLAVDFDTEPRYLKRDY